LGQLAGNNGKRHASAGFAIGFMGMACEMNGVRDTECRSGATGRKRSGRTA
jgi:hypothetical protein